MKPLALCLPSSSLLLVLVLVSFAPLPSVAWSTHACRATRLPAAIGFNADTLYPESAVWDPVNCRFITSSLVHATLNAVYPNGTSEVLVSDPDYTGYHGFPGFAAFGTKYNKGIVYVTIHAFKEFNPNLPAFDAVAAYNVLDPNNSFRIWIAKFNDQFPNVGVLNDLTIDEKGNLYVTDTSKAAIYKIDTDLQISLVSDDPLFKSGDIVVQPTNPFYNNGIDIHPRRKYLVVGAYSTGKLFKVSGLNKRNKGVKVSTVKWASNGTDIAIPGLDGISFRRDGSLLGSASFRAIFLFKSDDNYKTAYVVESFSTVVEGGAFSLATDAIPVGERVYTIYDNAEDLFLRTGPVKNDWLIREIGPFQKCH
eukprot:jgi/Chlat1/418/Chrsp10S01522